MFFVGKIIKVRGNRGEVIYISSDTKKYHPIPRETLILKSKKYQKKLIVEKYREINGSQVVKFKGIDSINEALKLVGYSIFNPHQSKITDRQNNLVNYIVKDIDGQLWGKVKGITIYNMNQILEVEDTEQKEVYFVPYSEEIVKEINRERHTIIIDPPKGLKSINQK